MSCVEVLSVVLLILVIVLYAAAVFVASDRRAALRNVGIAVSVSGLLILARPHGSPSTTSSTAIERPTRSSGRAVHRDHRYGHPERDSPGPASPSA